MLCLHLSEPSRCSVSGVTAHFVLTRRVKYLGWLKDIELADAEQN